MICKNCSFENSPDSTICTNCGAELSQEPPSDKDNNEVVQEIIDSGSNNQEENKNQSEKTSEYNEIIDNALEVVNEDNKSDNQMDNSVESQPSTISKDEASVITPKRSSFTAFSGLIALIILAVGLFIYYSGILAPKYDIPVDRSKNAVMYVKDDTLYAKPLKGESVSLSANLNSGEDSENLYYTTSTMLQSEDGKVTYFLEDFNTESYSGNLCVTYDNKTKKQIDTGVMQNFVISKDGKYVMYLKDADPMTGIGPLYVYKKGDDKPFSVAQKALVGTFMFGDNSKEVAYLDNVNEETEAGELYYNNLKGKSIKIDSDVTYGRKMSNKSEIIYLKNTDPNTYTSDLCYWKNGKDPIVIGSGINNSYVMTSAFSANTSYVEVVDNSFNLHFYRSGKDKSTLIMNDIMGFFELDVENQNFLIAKASDETAQNPDMYLKKGMQKPKLITTNLYSPSHGRSSLNYSTIAYISDFNQETGTGSLYIQKFLFGIKLSPKKIADNVSSFNMTSDGKTISYMTEMSEQQTASLYVYKNGKSIHIADNIPYGGSLVSDNGKAIYYLANFDQNTYSADLFVRMLTGSGKIIQIDDHVYAQFYSRNEKNVVYFKNYDVNINIGDLYLWNGNKSEIINEKVNAVMFE